jgi:FtsH-binding integral membrane protein
MSGATNPLSLFAFGGILLSSIAWFQVALSREARQKSPNKWWWLSLFTLGEAVSVGLVSSVYRFHSVILAMGATAIASVTVSAYTVLNRNSKYDLSQWGATLSSYVRLMCVWGGGCRTCPSCGPCSHAIFVMLSYHVGSIYILELDRWSMILLVYLLFGIAQGLGWLPTNLIPYSHMAYSAFATLLFSFYLAYHTKLIVGGKHAKYRMNEKDYVFGAMALYMDIVNIFLSILRLIGEDKKE